MAFPLHYKLSFANLYSNANVLSVALHVAAPISLSTKHRLALVLDRLCADDKANSSCKFNTNSRLSLYNGRLTFLI